MSIMLSHFILSRSSKLFHAFYGNGLIFKHVVLKERILLL